MILRVHVREYTARARFAASLDLHGAGAGEVRWGGVREGEDDGIDWARVVRCVQSCLSDEEG